jgi:serine/threonine-protein kinase RsbW
MGENHWIWRSDHVIGSDIEAGRRLLEELIQQLKVYRWSRRDVFSVHLAAEEALVNAIRHGNRCDPQKQVRVCCRLSDDRVRIEIADEGPGFNPKEVPDPTDPNRLAIPSGRGLMLMRSFMSTVEFADCGRRVVLEKLRGGARQTAEPIGDN